MTPSSSNRTGELYQLGIEKYQELMSYDLGENNALLCAIAAMLADSEKTRTWKTPALYPDVEQEDEVTTVRSSEQVTKRLEAASPRQLTLGNW